MAVRLHFIVEGQTEETFVKQILSPHLAELSIWAKARCVMTSNKRGAKRRGGVGKYYQVKNDIHMWMKEDQNPDARFTTMIDLYGLPSDFPGYDEAQRKDDPYERIRILENSFKDDITDHRFIPYFQLYEFEALLLSDPQKFDAQFFDRGTKIKELVELVSDYDSPELINDGKKTAPSKRIINKIPEYAKMKASAGPIIAEKIGLLSLRSKCMNFNQWLERLEALALPNSI